MGVHSPSDLRAVEAAVPRSRVAALGALAALPGSMAGPGFVGPGLANRAVHWSLSPSTVRGTRVLF